jgi:hypothetical protein
MLALAVLIAAVAAVTLLEFIFTRLTNIELRKRQSIILIAK